MIRYRVVRVPITHPLANINSSLSKDGKTVEALLHRVVLYAKIGPGPHPCHWCAKPVDWMRMRGLPAKAPDRLVTDHLDENIRNNDPDNLVPSCSGCNANRAHRLRIKPEELWLEYKGKRHRAAERTCTYCGKKFLVTLTLLAQGPTKGRFCSHSCTMKNTRRAMGTGTTGSILPTE